MNFVNHIISTFRRPVMHRGPSKLTEANQRVSEIPFLFTYEQHDTVSYQQRSPGTGRILPGLRKLDPEGNPIQGQLGERPWGPTVHILRLSHPNDTSQNILECMSDSLEDVTRMVREQLPLLFFGVWTAGYVRKIEQESREQIIRQRENLKQWVDAHVDPVTMQKILAGGK